MKKKILTTASLFLVAIALVVGSVAGTLAFLRSQAHVTNTFTYGKIAISMDESKISPDGKTVVEGERTDVGNRYLLMPSTSYVKDPVIRVGGESQPMYLFLKLDNGIAGLAMTEEEKTEGKMTIHEQLIANGWKVYTNTEDGVNYEYSKTTETPSNSGVKIISTSTVYYLSMGPEANKTEPRIVTTADTNIKTFEKFHTGEKNVTEASMTAYFNNGCQVVVTAYAVQKDGIKDIHDAASKFATEFASTKTEKTGN